ncbi:hypothetical protein [Actinomadura chokoriensis]|uniref:Uncharacterized protein n=1 Tax=Actinomadura chokoriensis TaxID=454156 RepID=A0ABV4R1J0_9ACTN
MTYWKFLRAGTVSPFTGHVWEPGTWYTAERTEPCSAGFHACRTADLPYWLGEELWSIELASPVAELPHKVVAPSARLRHRATEWTPSAAAEFALACVGRTAVHAAGELREAGLTGEAARLEDAASAAPADLPAPADPAAVADVARAGAEAAGFASRAARLCGLVVDAAEAAEIYPVASVAYIAARAANHRTDGGGADLYERERQWQAAWLAERLRLRD